MAEFPDCVAAFPACVAACEFVHKKGVSCTELLVGCEVCARNGYFVHRVVCLLRSLCTKRVFCAQSSLFAVKFVHEKGVSCTELLSICKVCARKGYFEHRVTHRLRSLCTKRVFCAQSCSQAVKFVHETGISCTELLSSCEVCARKIFFVHKEIFYLVLGNNSSTSCSGSFSILDICRLLALKLKRRCLAVWIFSFLSNVVILMFLKFLLQNCRVAV